MSSKMVVFDANSLLKLLTHFDDGVNLPLGAQLVAAGVNPMVERWVGLLVESDEWDRPDPLQIRYQRNKIMKWERGEETCTWKPTPEAPKLQ